MLWGNITSMVAVGHIKVHWHSCIFSKLADRCNLSVFQEPCSNPTSIDLWTKKLCKSEAEKIPLKLTSPHVPYVHDHGIIGILIIEAIPSAV